MRTGRRAAAQSRAARGVARLVIADDHELARAGLRAMIGDDQGFEIAGEATTGREALELCRRERPDLALLDLRMPDMDGLAATRAITAELPETRVVVITMHENPDYFFEARKAGAAGYLLKDASRREVVATLRKVLRGESLLARDPVVQPLPRGLESSALTPPRERLTPREHEVLRLLAQGQTNREIAKSLMLSAGTIKVHVEHILNKLDAADRTQAAVRAMELGLLNHA